MPEKEEDLMTVVFTLQTAGRCNKMMDIKVPELVVFTLQTAGRCN